MLRRIFLGISVPQAISHSLSVYAENLTDDRLKWVKQENYHITVSFFGPQDDQYITTIIDTINVNINELAPFRLKFQRICFAPPEKAPSMIWAQYQQTESFNELVIKVESAVKDIISFSDKRNSQNPIPHITLARFKHTDLRELPQIELDPIHVSTLNIFESKQTETGRLYTVLKEFPLI
jgi:RNA 2',3'-cyclic 3'-phosphodiesterase